MAWRTVWISKYDRLSTRYGRVQLSPPHNHPVPTPVGGTIAASWAVLQVMGVEGYLEVAERLMRVTKKMQEGIGQISVSYRYG